VTRTASPLKTHFSNAKTQPHENAFATDIGQTLLFLKVIKIGFNGRARFADGVIESNPSK
jgi:hypothetical protein